MGQDQKRELLRHMVATVAFRTGVAVEGAPATFGGFRATPDTRSPAELLAHIGDLIEGSHHLLRGEYVELDTQPLGWDDDIARVINAARDLDAFLASDTPPLLAHPPEKMVQGPIGDALTHVGQIVMLRRIAGCPISETAYFTGEIIPGTL